MKKPPRVSSKGVTRIYDEGVLDEEWDETAEETAHVAPLGLPPLAPLQARPAPPRSS